MRGRLGGTVSRLDEVAENERIKSGRSVDHPQQMFLSVLPILPIRTEAKIEAAQAELLRLSLSVSLPITKQVSSLERRLTKLRPAPRAVTIRKGSIKSFKAEPQFYKRSQFSRAQTVPNQTLVSAEFHSLCLCQVATIITRERSISPFRNGLLLQFMPSVFHSNQ